MRPFQLSCDRPSSLTLGASKPVPKSNRAEKSPLQAALRALGSALTASRARWMIIGGIAVIGHGVQRMTTDIDAVIEGGTIDLRALLSALQRKRIVPRIESPQAFAETLSCS
jgi:hypothetical protein